MPQRRVHAEVREKFLRNAFSRIAPMNGLVGQRVPPVLPLGYTNAGQARRPSYETGLWGGQFRTTTTKTLGCRRCGQPSYQIFSRPRERPQRVGCHLREVCLGDAAIDDLPIRR